MSIGITLLGATGSIGSSALDVIARHEEYEIIALTANVDVEGMLAQVHACKPRFAVMSDEDAAQQLRERLAGTSDCEVLSGVDGLERVATLDEADVVIAGIVGAAGLIPTLSAARSGKRVLLANKEALVMSGKLFIDTANANGAELLPVDSEHNAIFQCLPVSAVNERDYPGVDRILLTASGGPFRTYTQDQLHAVTPEAAVRHPNWEMGKKISVDSATLMNKGLEVIEAKWLFDLDVDEIEVVVHPQSIIHSMVTYDDGSVLAQMGNPDMRTPIAHALAWPRRIESGVEPLDLFEVAQLNFERPDHERFPCLSLCFQALERGGSASIVLNAANEIAVDAFLNDRIAFIEIPELIEEALSRADITDDIDSIDAIMTVDARARELCQELLERVSA